MRNRTDKKPAVIDFPPNYDWHSPQFFVPRVSQGVELANLVHSFLRNDTAFQHLLRQCKKKWIVAVTLSTTTASIGIYDPTDVDDLQRKPLSSNLVFDNTAIMETDRYCAMTRLSPERCQLVAGTRPFLSADRLLKSTEITLLATLERATTEEMFDTPRKVDPEDDQVMIDNAVIQSKIQFNDRRQLTREAIAAMGTELFPDLIKPRK